MATVMRWGIEWEDFRSPAQVVYDEGQALLLRTLALELMHRCQRRGLQLTQTGMVKKFELWETMFSAGFDDVVRIYVCISPPPTTPDAQQLIASVLEELATEYHDEIRKFTAPHIQWRLA